MRTLGYVSREWIVWGILALAVVGLVSLVAIPFSSGPLVRFVRSLEPAITTDEPVTHGPNPYVVWCQRLWTGPENNHNTLVMVWSDGDVWTARTDELEHWEPITTVRLEEP